MPPVPRRVVAALLCAAALTMPAAAPGQGPIVPDDGSGVSSTPPVPLAGSPHTTPTELPNTGTDPRMLFLTGLALTLLGFGLRLRTADADDY